MSIRATIQDQTTKIQEYIRKMASSDDLRVSLMAAQEKMLSTRSIDARVYHTRQDPRCRLCKDDPETVQHITAGCKMQAGMV